jgi:hypothetical protein
LYSKFRKIKIWKQIKSPSSMENGRFHPPSVGASFKKWECCIPIHLKCQVHPYNTKRKRKSKKCKKRGVAGKGL